MIRHPSPNHDSREGHGIDMLVLHYTGMPTMRAALERLCDPQAKVSAHYLVDEDGEVYQLVPESERGWHAGVSYWRGHTNINQRSIGIEIVNPGHEFGYRDFPPAQMQAVAALCRGIVSRHPIPARNVVAHSDVAPTRKEDPGERFDWRWLAQQGVGLYPDTDWRSRLGWYAVVAGVFVQAFRRGPGTGILINRQRRRVFRLVMGQLALWGYQTPDVLEENIDAASPVITAFQRRWRPARITGRWDGECQTLLDALLKAG